MAKVMFEDTFMVESVDPNKKKFDGVHRLYCKSSKMELILEINSYIYTVDEGANFHLVLATTSQEDDYPGGGTWSIIDQNGDTRIESFDYIMSGKVYNIESEETSNELCSRLSVCLSFGGLLMRLQGDADCMRDLEIDRHMFLLMKKVSLPSM